MSEFTKVHPEVCEHYCSNVSHGNLITAALTKTDVSDEALIYYMLSVCQHFSTARDSAGRSALHMAASCGRSSMVTWLVTYRNVKLEDKDMESGYTALHRSLFYGKINTAVALIKLGSNMNAMDEEGLSPLEHVMKDAFESQLSHTKFADGRVQNVSLSICGKNHLGELYCWGPNSNYTLLGRHDCRTAELSHFHKQYPDEHINTIHLEKYHCMVSCGSKVYAWGHGLGGRLGINTNSTVLVPETVKIELMPNVLGKKNFSSQHLDIAKDHSVFLDVRGYVWTCGMNEHSVLGVANVETQALLPICVSTLKDKKIVGVACGKYHSVAYSIDTLYTWGLNAGQLGHTADYGHYISTPKKVNHLLDGENDTILQVCCSDGAIGILASNNVIYILHEYQLRRVALKSTGNFRQLHLYGGKLESRHKDSLPQQQELHVAVVTATANLFLWRESDPHLRRCVFTLGRPLMVSNIVLNARGCVFTTRDHEVFLGAFKRRMGTTTKVDKDKYKEKELGKSAFHMFLEKDECVMVAVAKVPRLHRACYVTSDPDGDNFIVLQNNRCKEFFYDIPSILKENFEMEAYLHTLYNDYCDEDSLHDFKFVVENRTFYCHKYILAHACSELSQLVRKSTDNIYIVEAVPVSIFEEMLEFIYTGKCALVEKLHKRGNHKNTSMVNSNKVQENYERTKHNLNELSAFAMYNQESNIVTSKNVDSEKILNQLKLLLSCAKKFGLHTLQKRVEHCFEHNRSRCHVCVGLFEKEPVVQYQRKQFLDFSDIDVICKNGDKIKAHKCMLMRLDYFRNMFSTRWNQERKTIKIDYPPQQVQQLVDFIYTDRLFDDVCGMENLLILLVLSDELIVEKLRALCEFSLCKHINIKTVVHLYQCSILYGASILKSICTKFIVAHLVELLELRSLDSIHDEFLVEISNTYLKHKSGIFDKRLITPFTYISKIEEPPSDFHLEIIESDKYQAMEAQKVARKRTRRHKNSSASEPILDIAESTEIIESESNANDFTLVRSHVKPSSRILAITSATEKLKESVESDGDFTNLSLLSSSLVSSSFDESEFPDLSAVNLSGNSVYSKSPGKNTDWKNLPKLSQKARKKLLSESNCSSGTTTQSTITNPWKVLDVKPNDSITFDVVQRDISAIIKSERVQKENLNKMRNKLLSCTQIEDRAIFELEKFYNIDNIEDEIIEVRRVDSDNVAIPTWVAANSAKK